MTEKIPPSEPQETLYGVSQDTIRTLEIALEVNAKEKIYTLLSPLHAADVAVVIEYLSPTLRHRLIDIIRPHFNPEILAHLDETVRDEVVELIGPHDVAKAITSLDSDEIIDLIENLEQKQQREILEAIPDEDRQAVEKALTYPEGSAIRLMQREVICVPATWTVSQAIKHVAGEAEVPEKFYDLFVTDSLLKPLGTVPLSLLLRYPSDTLMKDIMDVDMKPIPALMDQEDVALLFRKYGLVSAPVVNEAGMMVGVITVDNIVEVINEEAEKDIMLLSRVTESDFYESPLNTSYSRLRWLAITLLNTLMAAFVISRFQPTIEKMVALAVLMPICAAMSGNAGMQVVTVTVRALATRELGGVNMNRAIWKEVCVGLINGIVFGSILGFVSALWFDNISLGLVLETSLMITMFWAAIGGVILPLLISKMNMDPAISAGPLLTTTTDLLGFGTFLGLAHTFLM